MLEWPLDEAPQSERPAEVDSDQIETLIKNNQCYTTRDIADITQNIQNNKVFGENEKRVHTHFLANPTGPFTKGQNGPQINL